MKYTVHTVFSTSRLSVNPHLRLALHVAVLTALMLGLATTAHAAGSSMPWEGPLQSILESIQGRRTAHRGDCQRHAGRRRRPGPATVDSRSGAVDRWPFTGGLGGAA